MHVNAWIQLFSDTIDEIYQNLWLQEYIVYMGDLPKGQVSASSLHASLLQEVTGR